MNNRPDFHDDSMFHDDSILARFFGKSSNYTDIPNSMFKTYNVKKGLRNDDGTGVRIGLTKVCDVVGYQEGPDGSIIPCEGDLTLRGYSLKDLVKNRFKHYGYEEMVFLLLFGFLPDRKEFDNFRKCLSDRYDLPADFLTNDILQMPSENLMNKLQSCTISLYNYAQEPDAQDVYQTLLKGIDMVAKFPSIVCYSYFAKMHHFYRQSLIIHYPRPEYSIAENILYMLRPDGKFTDKEASVLDGILMIHSEHGGGNNSTFTNVVMGSTGTDLYSAVCGSIGSLKGPKHGGANLSVSRMMQQIIADTHYSCDEKLLRGIVERILDKDYFDNSGLVYGFGHAVYTLSDPRCELLRPLCETLAEEQGCTDRFHFYTAFEKIVKKIICERTGKPVCTNVDYYSGFAYNMLGIPEDLFTPLFSVARVAGWVAHNIENKKYDGKIMRPATKYIGEPEKYVPLKKR